MDKVVKKHPLADCENCPLKDADYVPSQIPPQGSQVAFVSRSPGVYDARTGIPFSNPRGSKAVLDHLLARYNVSRDSIIATNVVSCRTDDPSKEAIKACSARLESEIEDCDLIIAGGMEATARLTNYRGVHRARGFSINRTSWSSGKDQRVVVTNNPAMVVRNSDAYPDMVKDFKRAFSPPPPPIYPSVEIIEDADTIRNILERWIETKFDTPLASDLEWYQDNTIECAGFSRNADKAVVLAGDGLRQKDNFLLLKRFYEREDIQFIWHNGKADTKVLRLSGINARADEDTFLLSYALDERPGYHTLEYLLSEEFGWPDYEPKSVQHFKKTGEFLEPKRLSQLELYKYNGMDTAGTLQLHHKYTKDPELDRGLYARLLKAADRFTTVELNGFHYDWVEACNIDEREIFYKLAEIKEHLRDVSKHTLLNPNSTDQVKAIWYTEWGLKHKLRNQGKKKFTTSVGKEVREEVLTGRFTCKPQHREQLLRFVDEFVHWQKITKMQGSFIRGLVKKVQKDGKLYCQFNVGGTATGRTSSAKPNFQNIMREGYQEIPGIRTLFLASPGNVLVNGDLSQAELRTCAKLSGERNLLGIYRDSNRSLHKERAKKFYGENYTKEEYVKSKNINFGVTYGQSAAAFAQMYHMPQSEAQAYIDSWWRDFPRLKEWTQEVGARAIKEGFVQSPFGHKRRFYLITSENIGDVKRQAVDFLPQNIAAWLTISAIIELVDNSIRVVATVHDSIVADVPEDEAKDVARFMQDTMQKQAIAELGWNWDDIPFLADVSIGPNWGALEELEFEQIAA
jgi:uracil-DNA glycosylase family 4